MFEWREAVLAECERRVGQYDAADQPVPLLQQAPIRGHLRWLQHHLVFVPVDKAASNIGIICQAEYCRILRDELE